MAWITSRRGGRSWFGKTEAKEAGRVTRRRDDRRAEREAVDRIDWSTVDLQVTDEEVDADLDQIDRNLGDEPPTEAEKTDALARELGYLEEDG